MESHVGYSVFPQTNTSRFLAVQAMHHIVILIAALVSLLFNLLQYALFALLSARHPYIVLANRFDWGFVISGFFVMILYLFLVTAMISLIATLIRKFRIYAILGLAFLGAISLVNPPVFIRLLQSIVAFLVLERNLGLFFIKGILLWVVLFGASLIINKHTAFYRSSMRSDTATMIAIVFVTTFFLMGLTLPFMIFSGNGNGQVTESIVYNSPLEEIVLDASHVPHGSDIEVITTNITLSSESGTYDDDSYDDFVDDSETIFWSGGYATDFGLLRLMYLNEDQIYALKNFDGERIVIAYELPNLSFRDDSIDLSHFVTQEFSARLEETTLYLDYQFTRGVNAVIIPIWPFMAQFEQFQGRDLLIESISSHGSASGKIDITVE